MGHVSRGGWGGDIRAGGVGRVIAGPGKKIPTVDNDVALSGHPPTPPEGLEKDICNSELDPGYPG